MTLAQLNAKIDMLRHPASSRSNEGLNREEARYLRDERLGILGVCAGQEPTEEQVQIVHDQLFPTEQKTLL